MAAEYPLVHLTTRQELHDWFEEHHATSRGMWLVSWRSEGLGRRVAYEDVVCECLCYGWIDSTARTVDDDRRAIRLTPRKPGSVWAPSNKARLERLLAEGQVRPAGLAVIERAKTDGSWNSYDEVDQMIVPDDLAEALAGAGASDRFADLAPSRRKQALWWIKSAKRDATRERRIAQVVAAAGEGRVPFA